MRKLIACLVLCLLAINVSLAGTQDQKKNTFAELATSLREISKGEASDKNSEKLVALSKQLIEETDPFAKRQYDLVSRVTAYLFEQGHYEHAETLCTELVEAAADIRGRTGETLVQRAKDSLALVRDKMGAAAGGGDDIIGKNMVVAGTTVDGSNFSSSEYEGKYVLIDYWATWCGPCIAELPNVIANYEKYHEQGLEIVGVSLDNANNQAGVAKFTAENRIGWVNLFSGDAQASGWEHPMATKYGINAIPATYLLDKEGKVIARNLRGEALGKKLEELFAADSK